MIELRIAILGLEHARERLSLARKHKADPRTMLACEDDMVEAHQRLKSLIDGFAARSAEVPVPAAIGHLHECRPA